MDTKRSFKRCGAKGVYRPMSCRGITRQSTVYDALTIENHATIPNNDATTIKNDSKTVKNNATEDENDATPTVDNNDATVENDATTA